MASLQPGADSAGCDRPCGCTARRMALGWAAMPGPALPPLPEPELSSSARWPAFPVMFVGVAVFLAECGRSAGDQRRNRSPRSGLWLRQPGRALAPAHGLACGPGHLPGLCAGRLAGASAVPCATIPIIFPTLLFDLNAQTVFEAALASLLASGAGTALAVWRCCQPATRPGHAPGTTGALPRDLDRAVASARYLSQPTRMGSSATSSDRV